MLPAARSIGVCVLLGAALGAGPAAVPPAYAAVAPTRPWLCPGDHPIKITAAGTTLPPWGHGYGSAPTLACYRSKAAAAQAGYRVPLQGK